MGAKVELMERLIADGQDPLMAEINAIPGRRLPFWLTGRVRFNIDDNGRRGNPVNLLISQDGPFIMTHMPMVVWRPVAPDTATMFGLWRPVSPWPLPDQFIAGTVDGDTDVISISFEMQDGGSQRNLQNERVPPTFSRPDILSPAPVPALFSPNTTIQLFPTYERILFNNADVATTEGELVVTLPGYRVVNL